MADLEHNSPGLSRIHRANNDRKYFCHFTGFLEGIAASGKIEVRKIEPLLSECVSFVNLVSDGDATDIIQDFQIEVLGHDQISSIIEIRINDIDQTCSKSSANRFLGFCRGIVCDGLVTTAEAEKMIAHIEMYPTSLETQGVKEIYRTCLDALADGIVDDHESIEICAAIENIVGDSYSDTGLSHATGVANFEEKKIGDLEEFIGAFVSFTGTFKTKPRRELEIRILDLGAIIHKTPTKQTNYLIVGGEASRDWIEMNRGTKITRARELRCFSDQPHFVSEHQFMKLLESR